MKVRMVVALRKPWYRRLFDGVTGRGGCSYIEYDALLCNPRRCEKPTKEWAEAEAWVW